MGNLSLRPRRALGLVTLAALAGPGLGFVPPARAQPITEDEVPAPLRPWIPWVLDGYPDYGCTRRESAAPADTSGELLCVWPSELVLEVESDGARFSLDVTADRDLDVALPGGPGAWPSDVRIDGRAVAVGGAGDLPFVLVEAGSSHIEGRIAWDGMPETLPVPDDVARIVLVDRGARTIASRGTDGDVWLRAPDSARATEADTVRLEVHRRLTDGSPLELVTRITMRASGSPRELTLGDVLPDGSVPVAVTADIPTRMHESGDLTLQIRAGTFQVELRAFVASPEAPLRRPDLPEPWPAQEVWVWVPNESFRQVEITGAAGIDPERTTLPDEWRSYSAYLLDAESVLTLATSRRGEPTPPPNRLDVSRDVWLDLDGGGASVSDSLGVEMHAGFRLELMEGELGRVRSGTEDQIITRATEDGRPGVEIRRTSSNVVGEWRIEGGLSSLPAVGWSEDAQSSSTALHLPPGWELVHASGVDRTPGTWTDRWTLLGFFALLIIAIGVARAFGPGWGLCAFAGVGLAYHESDAPLWVWLVLAGLFALHHALGARPFERWVRRAYLLGVLVAALATVPFAAIQLRNAHYPVLDRSETDSDYGGLYEETPEWLDDTEGGTGARAPEEGMMGEESAERPTNRYGIEGPEDNADPHMAREAARDSAASAGAIGALRGLSGSWNSPSSGDYTSNANWLDPTAVVQTGFGMPTWRWRTYELGFDGPVSDEHRISLWLAPPIVTRLCAFLRAALMLALLAVVILRRPRPPIVAHEPGGSASPDAPAPAATASDSSPQTGAAAAGAAATLALLALFVVASAQAQPAAGVVPPADVLAELGERLTRAPVCGDHCAEATSMTITADGESLAIDIAVSALAPAVYPLPGPTETWAPERVLLDGRPADALVRLASGFVHVRLAAGTHLVRVEGSLGGRDSLTLALGRTPRSLDVTTVGWETTGTGTDERVAESVVLHRSIPRTPDEDDAAAGAGSVHVELPAWLEVTRHLDIGVRWTLSSTVTRRSPVGAPAVIRIPLLRGESVTDATVVAEEGFAVVSLGQNESTVSWTSVLDASSPEIVLTAPETGRLSEVWSLSCSPLWHCDTSGLSPTTSAGTTGASWGMWEPRFDPWPGESLTIALSRPHPVEGRSTTIDEAVLTVSPGSRLSSSVLALTVRTSVSAPLSITLPAGAEVRSLSVGGTARPIQLDAGTLTVTLQPGSHAVRLEWQEPTGITTAYTTPAVSLGGAAVNLTLDVDYSSDRWVLYIGGPAWGPAVLFWPYLVLVLVLAYGLSRRRELLPRAHQWALLALGLTQVEPAVALFVVGWFLVLEWRRTDALPGWFRFDVRQLFIAGYTFVWCIALVDAVQSGLLGTPGMDIEGPDTYGTHLHFFVDRTDGALPTATLVSVPVWVFRVLMFLWAAWLAFALVRWARAGWTIFAGGDLWRTPPKGAPPGRPPQNAAGASAGPAPTSGPVDTAASTLDEPQPHAGDDASMAVASAPDAGERASTPSAKDDEPPSSA